MFDIGFWEILLIGVVSLLVIGPEKLPEVARTVGKWVGKVQRFVAGVKADFNSDLNSGELRKLLGDQESQIRELKQMVNDTRKGFEEGASDATSVARENLESMKQTIESDSEKSPVSESVADKPQGTENQNERISKS